VSDILEVIPVLSYWSGSPAVASVIVTAALLVISEDRRVLVTALAIQYLFVGLLYTNILAPQVAGIKTTAGIVVWLIVFFSVQQSGWRPGSEVSESSIPWVLGARARFRVFAVILAALIGWKLALPGTLPFPVASEYVTFAALQLTCLGLLLQGLAGHPLKSGLGILTFLTGFGLLYSGVEPALMVVGVLAAVEVAVALSISYLTIVHMLSSRVSEEVR